MVLSECNRGKLIYRNYKNDQNIIIKKLIIFLKKKKTFNSISIHSLAHFRIMLFFIEISGKIFVCLFDLDKVPSILKKIVVSKHQNLSI